MQYVQTTDVNIDNSFCRKFQYGQRQFSSLDTLVLSISGLFFVAEFRENNASFHYNKLYYFPVISLKITNQRFVLFQIGEDVLLTIFWTLFLQVVSFRSAHSCPRFSKFTNQKSGKNYKPCLYLQKTDQGEIANHVCR